MQDASILPPNNPPSRAAATLSLDHKRQVIYSSLLRFSAETVPLREAALDHVVLGALIGSSLEKPFKIGQVQSNLSFGDTSPQIREDVVRQALGRLVEQEKVVEHHGLARKSFYLNQKGTDELSRMIGSSQNMFDAVLETLLQHTQSLFTYEQGCVVCRKFIFECFSRFGRNLARTVTGNLNREELIQAADLGGAFRAAIQGAALSPTAVESLRARCTAFLKSNAPQDVQLKFHLSQGYYFAQLLGFEDKGFNPLSKEAFCNSTFYLDTNVLLAGTLAWQTPESLFDEVVTIAKQLGISLKVTRATLNEAGHVITEKERELTRIFGTLPTLLIMKSEDEFIHAFTLARGRNTALTLPEFFASLHALEHELSARWGIELDDRTEHDILQGRNFDRVRDLFDAKAEKYRAFKKSENVLLHDVAHYALVQDARKVNPKTWFLTRDRTLMEAASELAVKTQPFSFLLLGFLHSISPFLTSKNSSLTFVELLSAFITQEIIPTHALFSTSELAIMAEFHDEVMSTPAEQLELAFDYIKSRVLEGKQYKVADIPRVSLELRKFLAKPKEEQIRALQAERERLEAERLQAEQKATASQSEAEAHKHVSASLHAELAALRASHSEMEGKLGSLLAMEEKRSNAWRFWSMIFGLAIGTAGFCLSARLANLLSGPLSLTTASGRGWVDLALRVAGAIAFVTPSYIYLVKRKLSGELTTVFLGLVVATCLYASHIFRKEAISEWADSIGFATPIVIVLLAWALHKRRSQKR